MFQQFSKSSQELSNRHYEGRELELFEKARNWKSYYSRFLKNHIGRNVLEVGAGIGATTRALSSGKIERWICLEPDLSLSNDIAGAISRGEIPTYCKPVVGVISDLKPSETFDTILYIDVLEHIFDDRQELEAASRHLTNRGSLIVLAPAHDWLYTAFDREIGHYRRYSKATLLARVPKDLTCVRLSYLDSAGALASLGNKFFLRRNMPTKGQISFWDTWLIPVSEVLDQLLRFTVGKSIIGIWKKMSAK